MACQLIKISCVSNPSSTSMASPDIISLKLLVYKDERVLFAEATKDFVDFLFNIFSIPLGTLAQSFGSNQEVGCLGKLKESVDGFNETYLQPGVDKDDIINPKTPFNGNIFLSSSNVPVDVDPSGAMSDKSSIYRCSIASGKCLRCRRDQGCRSYVTQYLGASCPGCNGFMTVKMTSVEPKEVETKVKEGYVKDVVTYMVMDDLVVNPMSSVSISSLINKLDVQHLSQLEEKTVSFGKDEGVKLVKASLLTNKVLTSIFLHKNN